MEGFFSLFDFPLLWRADGKGEMSWDKAFLIKREKGMPYTFRIRRNISVYDQIVVNSLISTVYFVHC